MGVIRKERAILNYQYVRSSYGSVLLCKAPGRALRGPRTVLRDSPHPYPKGSKASSA